MKSWSLNTKDINKVSDEEKNRKTSKATDIKIYALLPDVYKTIKLKKEKSNNELKVNLIRS